MKRKEVRFTTISGQVTTGVIRDKVLVMQVGGAASYHNYVIEDDEGDIHIVNPLNIKSTRIVEGQ